MKKKTKESNQPPPDIEARISSMESKLEEQRELVWRLLNETEKMIESSFEIVKEDQGQPKKQEEPGGYA